MADDFVLVNFFIAAGSVVAGCSCWRCSINGERETVIAVRIVCHMADKRTVTGDMQFAKWQDLTQWRVFLQSNEEVVRIELSLPNGQWADYTRLPLLGWDKKEGGK